MRYLGGAWGCAQKGHVPARGRGNAERPPPPKNTHANVIIINSLPGAGPLLPGRHDGPRRLGRAPAVRACVWGGGGQLLVVFLCVRLSGCAARHIDARRPARLARTHTPHTNKKNDSKLSAGLCDVVEGFGLVTFVPLAVADAASLRRLLNAVDKANGAVYAGE